MLVSTLTVDERAAVDALKASAGLGDDADIVRLALWRLADHYELRLPILTFAIGASESAKVSTATATKATTTHDRKANQRRRTRNAR